MGLIKALVGSAEGVLADQWREFFYCEAMSPEVLVRKGQKRVGSRSSNDKGSENVITNGSNIVVADGQCMIIVENGKVVEVCAEPGKFTYNNEIAPSVFTGDLGDAIKESFKNIGKRFTFGGEPGQDQRIYYFNMKEIIGNKYGTPSPVPFRVVDNNIGLDVDISLRCHGEYSYKIVNPLMFFTNVCGNVTQDYQRTEIDSQLKTELLTALQPAFAQISALGVRYSAIPAHTGELANALNDILSQKWAEMRGIKVHSFGVSSVKASEEDENMIKELQRNAVFRNTNMAAAHMVGAQAQAMQTAAGNEGGMGAMMGFMGMNMANQTGGMNAQNLFAMGQEQAGSGQANQAQQVNPNTWTCECGDTNTGKFCDECGKPKPNESKGADTGWSCECGQVNKGKFCAECGAKKPAGLPTYQCDKCKWEPEDPTKAPKFCPECGDVFDENDIKK